MRTHGKKLRLSLNARILHEFYILPALIAERSMMPCVWDESEVWNESWVWGLRFRFLIFDVPACILWRGKCVDKPQGDDISKLIATVVMNRPNTWWKAEPVVEVKEG